MVSGVGGCLPVMGGEAGVEVAWQQSAYWILVALSFLLLSAMARRLRLRWWVALPLRLLFIAAVLLPLFLPTEQLVEVFSEPRRQLLVLDQSDSLLPIERKTAIDNVRRWMEAAPNRVAIVFGRDAHVLPNANTTVPEIDGRASNLAEALELARRLSDGSQTEIILASDGLVNDANQASELVNTMVADGTIFTVLPMRSRESRNDAYVGVVWAPSLLWQGASFPVVLPVYMPESGAASVRLSVNGEVVNERSVQLPAGEQIVSFVTYVRTLGPATLDAEVIVDGDPFLENNRSFAITRVYPSPNVLLVTGEPEQRTALLRALRSASIEADTILPETLTTDVESLRDYEVIFLDSFLARELSQEQMLALRVFVSRLGGGLILFGGLNSYTLGGYQNSLLEPLLPVRLQPPPREERPPHVFIIVLDRSASMEAGDSVYPPIDLAREAAMRAIEILEPTDYVGVLTFGSDVTWDVPVGLVGEGLTLRLAQDTISQITAHGTTQMFSALVTATHEIEAIGLAERPVILLLSDGESSDGNPEEFLTLSGEAAASGTVISTIAFGPEADVDLLSGIAELTQGRFYRVLEPAELPEIMVRESRAARSENVQLGRTGVLPVEPNHPILAGLPVANLPPLAAYNAVSSRAEEGAEDLLVSASFGDPVLSAWQYGLGRVVAWTGDAGQGWADRWVEWADADLFWSQVIRYALVTPDLEPAEINVAMKDGLLDVRVHIESGLDVPLNLADPILSFAASEGTGVAINIPQIEPGTYHVQTEPLPAGAYRAVLAYRDGEVEREIPGAFAVNYPEEWRPDVGAIGPANLAHWQSLSGSEPSDWTSLLSLEELQPAPTAHFEQREQLLSRLLMALVVLWPLEIAIRRRWLPWS